jgi:hypothetical protein
MNQLTPEEQQRILQGPPKGTFALLMVFAALFFGAWLYMYFGMFLPHGPVR